MWSGVYLGSLEYRGIAYWALFRAYERYGPWQGQCISRVPQPYPLVSRSPDIEAVLGGVELLSNAGGGGRAWQPGGKAACRPPVNAGGFQCVFGETVGVNVQHGID